MIAGLKGQGRSVEKVTTKMGGDWSRLTDIVRGTVLVPHHDDLPQAIAAIRAEVAKNGWKVSAFEDGFLKPNAYGYRDMKLTLESPDGHQCELQINTTQNFIAKENSQTSRGEGGHKLYEVARPFLEARSAGQQLTPEQEALCAEMQSESQQLYGAAWEKSLQMQPVLKRNGA